MSLIDLARADYWRAVMYLRLKQTLPDFEGEGVEFGGSNGIIQGMLPQVKFEVRRYPAYDITDPNSFEREWDVLIADQILEHVDRPWKAFELIGEHARAAIITVPFMIRIHGSPRDYWRMTPKAIQMMAQPYFNKIDIQSWGTAKASYWHNLYNRTSELFRNVPEEELIAELMDNVPNKPFVIWAVLRK